MWNGSRKTNAFSKKMKVFEIIRILMKYNTHSYRIKLVCIANHVKRFKSLSFDNFFYLKSCQWIKNVFVRFVGEDLEMWNEVKTILPAPVGFYCCCGWLRTWMDDSQKIIGRLPEEQRPLIPKIDLSYV